MTTIRLIVLLTAVLLPASLTTAFALPSGEASADSVRNSITERYRDVVPKEWGERIPGIKTRLATKEKLIALTFDACGSAKGMGVDVRLLGFLEKEQVPATLFINARWIDGNGPLFDRLAANPLFEIGNHGYRHKPASVTGRSVYGIKGTGTIEELIDEIELNADKIEARTGRKPRFFRSGTAYYDDVAVRVAADLGEEIAGFSVLGDAGATMTHEQVKKALLAASPGDIIILHMNHPESGTAAGVIDAVPELRKRGYRFVRLSDYPLR